MACFAVPAAEAVITTAAELALKKYGHDTGSEKIKGISKRLGLLNKMLWGGSALLAFEHLWHGEISPVYPFLTAASDPQSAAVMIEEMATAGVAMALLVTVVWIGISAAGIILEKRIPTEKSGEAAGQ